MSTMPCGSSNTTSTSTNSCNTLSYRAVRSSNTSSTSADSCPKSPSPETLPATALLPSQSMPAPTAAGNTNINFHAILQQHHFQHLCRQLLSTATTCNTTINSTLASSTSALHQQHRRPQHTKGKPSTLTPPPAQPHWILCTNCRAYFQDKGYFHCWFWNLD